MAKLTFLKLPPSPWRELAASITALLLALAMSPLVRAAIDQEKIWSDYLEWVRTQPVSVTSPLAAYLENLKTQGLGIAELEQRRQVLEKLSKERRSQLRVLFFDRTYSDPSPRFNPKPNALLVKAVEGRPPGRALDVHMGQGRNALFLATKGWQVTGFDASSEGIRKALEAARQANVKIEALVASHEEFDFGNSQWDLILLSYTWLPLQEPYVSRIVRALRPGGLLVFEHMMDESGSPSAAPWLPKPNQLLRLFSDLRILYYEDTRDQADWSWRPERVARLIAEKPPLP